MDTLGSCSAGDRGDREDPAAQQLKSLIQRTPERSVLAHDSSLRRSGDPWATSLLTGQVESGSLETKLVGLGRGDVGKRQVDFLV